MNKLSLRRINVALLGIQGACWVVLLFVILFAFIQFQTPKRLSKQYMDLKTHINENLRKEFNQYLLTGNAVTLHRMEKTLSVITDEHVALLPKDIQRLILPSFAELDVFIHTELRAAGKLSHNVDALLLQNEMSTAASMNYIMGALNQSDFNQHHIMVIAKMFSQLMYRARLREQYMSTGDEHLYTSVMNANSQLKKTIEALKNLPPVYIKPSSNLEVLVLIADTEIEDPYQENVDDIASLVKRYEKEIKSTQKNIIKRIKTQERADELLGQLSVKLSSIEQEINFLIEDIIQKALFMSVLVLFINFIMMMLNLKLQHEISRYIAEMGDVFELLAKGDFNAYFQESSHIKEFKMLAKSGNYMSHEFSKLLLSYKAKAMIQKTA